MLIHDLTLCSYYGFNGFQTKVGLCDQIASSESECDSSIVRLVLAIIALDSIFSSLSYRRTRPVLNQLEYLISEKMATTHLFFDHFLVSTGYILSFLSFHRNMPQLSAAGFEFNLYLQLTNCRFDDFSLLFTKLQMNFAFLVVLLISIGLASAQLGQLLGFNQQQCPLVFSLSKIYVTK